MRIAQVVRSDAFAGVERYVLTLANGLSEAGFEVVVVGGMGERMRPELLPGVEWRAAATVTRVASELVRLGHFDVVHAHMTAAETAAILAKPVSRGKLVVTRHFAAERGSSALGGAIAPMIRGMIDAQVSISHFVAERIDGSSEVVYPGVPPERASKQGEDGRNPVVLVTQRFESEKETAVALRAFADSELAGAGWELHMAGRGKEEPVLRRLAAELGLDDACRWLGFVSDVGQELRSAGLFLATAPAEPFGLAVVEAMAAGTPVVAAGGGGHRETVGACSDAALFPPGDYKAASKLLVELASDETGRRRYGEALKELQRERFRADQMVEGVIGVYRRLIPA